MAIGFVSREDSDDKRRAPEQRLGKLFQRTREARGYKKIPPMILALYKRSDLPRRWDITQAIYTHLEKGRVKRPDREILATLITFFKMTSDEAAEVWRLADRNICHPEPKKDNRAVEDDRIEDLTDELFNRLVHLLKTEGHDFMVPFVADPIYPNLKEFEQLDIAVDLAFKLVERGKRRENRKREP